MADATVGVVNDTIGKGYLISKRYAAIFSSMNSRFPREFVVRKSQMNLFREKRRDIGCTKDS